MGLLCCFGRPSQSLQSFRTDLDLPVLAGEAVCPNGRSEPTSLQLTTASSCFSVLEKPGQSSHSYPALGFYDSEVEASSSKDRVSSSTREETRSGHTSSQRHDGYATAAPAGDRAPSTTTGFAPRSVATAASLPPCFREQSTHSMSSCVGTMSPKDLFSDIKHLVYLGSGAYGTVYQGIWHGATVAIKFIKSETLDAQSVSAREAAFSSMLQHPHVVQTFWSRSALLDDEFVEAALRDHQEQNQHTISSTGPKFVSGEGFGDPAVRADARTMVSTYSVLHALTATAGHYLTAIAMEFMDNLSLHEVVTRGVFKPNAKWGPRIVLRALSRSAREVARGIWHLHSSGVIHGDLKPANVLLRNSRTDRRGFVCKVSDFGLARECIESQGLVRASTWSTLSYMAPEHFEGTLCKASDVYSFGVMLHEMYTGERPLKDYTFGQIMLGVQSGRLRPEWPTGSPTALAALSQRCMAQRTCDRPTFDVIIEELNAMEDAMRMEEFNRRRSLAEESRSVSSGSFSGSLSLDSSGLSSVRPQPVSTHARSNGAAALHTPAMQTSFGGRLTPPPHVARSMAGTATPVSC